MTSHSPNQLAPFTAKGTAVLPKQPVGSTPSREDLVTLAKTLSKSCYDNHNRRVDDFKRAGVPRDVTERLTVPSAPTSATEGCPTNDDRRALLRLTHRYLQDRGAAAFAGLVDHIDFAERFDSIAKQAASTSNPESELTSLSAQLVAQTRSLAESLVVSIATAQAMDDKQSALVSLSALITHTKEAFPNLSQELFDARSRVLEVGAETPVWTYGR